MEIFELRQIIENSQLHKNMIEDVKKEAAALIGTTIPVLKFSEWRIFEDIGSRKEFEKSYYDHRRRLNTFAFMAMIDDDSVYLSELEDIIWAICDEHTWALPAHLWGATQLNQQRVWIDLFAAETGFALSEINYLLRDKLSARTKERIYMEVHDRIISGFLNRAEHFHWESIVNNWAAVCAGSVGIAFMYLAEKEEFEQALPRLLSAMDSFLSSFGEDGCCMEGGGYWTYGFGFFCYFAEKLRDYTNGEINLFDSPKVKNIALFQQTMFLRDDKIANFSDCTSSYQYQLGLTHFLAKEYPQVTIPPQKYAIGFYGDHCYRWGHTIRDFMWFDPSLPTANDTHKYCFLPDALWYINTKDRFAFAAKGGCNDEPHNHNDVGSFIFVAGDDYMLYELGMGEYTHEYFKPETRYTFVTNSSRGHSLPIINGNFQKEGKEYCGEIINQNQNEFCVDIAKAYGIDELKSLERSFKILENGVELIDTYKFNDCPDSIIERFVTLTEPKLGDEAVYVAGGKIEYDQTAVECTISSEDYSAHNGLDTLTVYFIDFKHRNPSKNCSAAFRIQAIQV